MRDSVPGITCAVDLGRSFDVTGKFHGRVALVSGLASGTYLSNVAMDVFTMAIGMDDIPKMKRRPL